jgi:hypothetical protein
MNGNTGGDSDGYYRSVDVQVYYQEAESPSPQSTMVSMDTNEPDIYRVAMCMDQWLIAENEAYDKVMREKNDHIKHLECKLSAAMASCNRMANILVEQDIQLDQLILNRQAYWRVGIDHHGIPIPLMQSRVIDLTADEVLDTSDEEDFIDFLMGL